ncbi:MAG TPA: alpha/beta hydrolase-fold protein [Bacteroidia bacterium]|jgi:predicted alpha/beta superfamily hydrolase|nr:alpha/beta hydrolase-fold protein [Bacteroidia bacterium]
MKSKILFIVLCFSSAVLFAQSDSSKPFILGRIETIQSVQLGEKRTINIYLPDGYSKNDTNRYPVIYLLDGSADEDFIHTVGQVQFCSFPWVNYMPPTIVVGIANTDRKRDFTFPSTIDEDKKLCPTSGHSDKFIAFIEKELQPYINSKYKTNASKTLIGESLGGLLAAEIVLKHPSLFNKYIIISPSLWWDNASLLKLNPDILNDTYKAQTDIYIGVGKEGLAPVTTPHGMIEEAKALSDKLKTTKSKNVKVYFDYLPDENHATISEQAIYNAFKVLFTAPAGK